MSRNGRRLVAAPAGGWALAAGAAEDPRTRADLLAAGARWIPAEPLRELMTGSRIVTYDGTGLDRAWTNHADGEFVASVRRTSLGSGTGQGRWRITDAGAYCVRIEWQWGVARHGERWCDKVYQVGERYYGLPHTDPVRPDHEVRARVIEIRKRIEQMPVQP